MYSKRDEYSWNDHELIPSYIQTRPTYIQQEACVYSKDTYIYSKEPNTYSKDVYLRKETFVYEQSCVTALQMCKDPVLKGPRRGLYTSMWRPCSEGPGTGSSHICVTAPFWRAPPGALIYLEQGVHASEGPSHFSVRIHRSPFVKCM